MPVEESKDRILLVEGIDEKKIVESLCDTRQDFPDFYIEDKEGFDKLKKSIEAEVRAPNRSVVGILVDANDNLSGRWDSIRHQLEKSGIKAPNRLQKDGIVIRGRPQVGVWIMPDNCSTGELEHFVRFLIPPNDPVWRRAEEYICGIPECDRRFKPQKSMRAKVHAWLATREEPRRIGQAIRSRDLDAGAPQAGTFVDWLHQLFG